MRRLMRQSVVITWRAALLLTIIGFCGGCVNHAGVRLHRRDGGRATGFHVQETMRNIKPGHGVGGQRKKLTHVN